MTAFPASPLPAPVRRIDRMVGIVAGGILAACALGIAGMERLLRPAPAPVGSVMVEVAGQRIALPGTWIRGGPVAGRASGPVEIALPVAGVDAPVAVRLGPADGSLPPADRPAVLYARFLAAEAAPLEGGLIRREFRAGTPYEGEVLFLAPPDGRAFAARCPARPDAPEACLAELRFGSLEARMRLRPGDLPRWTDALAALAALLGEDLPARMP